VFVSELNFGRAAPDVRLVRWELFVFPGVRDVLAGPRPETVVVVHRGPARVDAWLAQLRGAGLLTEDPPSEGHV